MPLMSTPRRPFVRRLARGGLVLAVLLGVAYLVGWALASPRPPHPYLTDLLGPGPHVHAHQGGDHLWPGNTMLAFAEAHAMGVDVLELDTQITADGVIVVIHDDTVDRTTDGAGAVVDMTFDELQTLDAAYRWRPPGGASDAFPYRAQGLRIPTLREVLETFPDVGVNVDMKSDDPRVPAATCALIREVGREATVMVASFVQSNLHAFRALCPEVATSAGPDEVRTFVFMNLGLVGRLHSPRVEAFQVPLRAAGIEIVTPRFVRGLRERGVQLDVWTINDEAEMRRLVDMGVGALITDRPDLALRVVGR
jgi:glycerophosphoryl diester phosphodiesterase